MFNIFKKAAEVKNKLGEIIDMGHFLMNLADAADDDLDGDHKPEVQNIFEELDAVKDETIADVKEEIAHLKAKAQDKRVKLCKTLDRAKKLKAHIDEKAKK